MHSMFLKRPRCFLFGVVAMVMFTGCDRSEPRPVVTLYSSVDVPFTESVVKEFERQTGITVQLKGDTEAGKTTGLVNRIRAERGHPQADVFWSSEIFNTINLADEGLLAEYRPPAEGIPDRYRDPKGRWTAFGLRARVVAYNTTKVKPEQLPKTWRQLPDPQWKGALGVANPYFGTTRGHFAAFYALWGEEEYVRFLKELRETTGGELMDGNATAARFVGQGRLLICATDDDDVYARKGRGEPVEMVHPDLGDGGTLLIPNTVALLAGAPHPETARKLIGFLTSAHTERMLAESDSGNIPVRADLRKELGRTLPPETKLSYQQIAAAMEPSIKLAREYLVK